MNQNVRVDLTGVADIDPRAGTKMKIPTPKPNLPMEQTVVEAGLKSYVALNLPNAGVVNDLVNFKANPNLRITTVGKMKHATVKPCTHFTIALGPAASAGALLTVGVSGGVYGSNLPEVGLFGSISYGAITNVSASFVGQVMYLFGVPSVVLDGDSRALGVEIGGKVLTGGGFLIFSEKVRPELIGFGFQFGVGASVLPFDFTVTKSKTSIVGTP